jgi:hypothetical protein
MVEIVTKPMRVLDGDVGRPDPDTVLRAVQDVRRRLYRAGKNSTRHTAIEKIFPQRDGFRIADVARGAVVGGSEQSEDGRSSYTQFTVGVPVNGLYEFLRTANAATVFPKARESLRHGLELADQIADMFVNQYVGGARSMRYAATSRSRMSTPLLRC